MEKLTPKERKTVAEVGRDAGASSQEIAARLHISEHTLRNHLTSIYAKLELSSRVELYAFAKEIGAPIDLVREVKRLGRLPVVNFAAGGVATPADAALMMQLGMDGVFVGSGIFKSGDPVKRGQVLASMDAQRFDSGMGTDFLARIGEIASAALSRLR